MASPSVRDTRAGAAFDRDAQLCAECGCPQISSFLARYPRVRLQLVATDRAVDLIEDRLDLAPRVRSTLTSDAALTMLPGKTDAHPRRLPPACPHSGEHRTIGDIAHSGNQRRCARSGMDPRDGGWPQAGRACRAKAGMRRHDCRARRRHRRSGDRYPARSCLPRCDSRRAPRSGIAGLAWASGNRTSGFHDPARAASSGPRAHRSSSRTLFA